MKKRIIIILIVIVLIAWVGLTLFNTGMNDLQNMKFAQLDISSKPNGFYYGECHIGRWRNEVVLRLDKGKIIEINFIKDQMVVSDETRTEIIKRIMNQQQVPIDAIAGATVTSNAYLKAIVEALKAGPQLPPKF